MPRKSFNINAQTKIKTTLIKHPKGITSKDLTKLIGIDAKSGLESLMKESLVYREGGKYYLYLQVLPQLDAG